LPLFGATRFNSSVVDRSQIGVVSQDIKAMISPFASVSVIHVFRHSNIPAHTLARSAKQFISVIFRNFISDCIRQTFCNVVS
jgi:hypothetical protein